MNNLISGKADTTKSYGIRNVHERIQYAFGDNYGLEFSNSEPAGVIVTIKIPAKKKLEEPDAENDHSR